jgi:hypothetical protein
VPRTLTVHYIETLLPVKAATFLRGSGKPLSALALFVLFLAANHEQHALAPHDLAVSTNLLY